MSHGCSHFIGNVEKMNLGTIHLRRRYAVGGGVKNLPTDSTKKLPTLGG